jgi:redox-sensing transcriptional repressor
VKSDIPAASISRLPVYLRSLGDLPPTQDTCSSEQLASIAGVNSAQVRKDLSHLGSYGTRGVGYDVAELRDQLRHALGLTRGYAVAIIGAGNLGSALSNYAGFGPWGFEVAAIFDNDASKVGVSIGGLDVEPLSRLEPVVRQRRITIGIIATPAGSAQEVADRLTKAGVRSILNFAPAVIHVAKGVEVRRVDLSTELQILTFHQQR